MTSFRLLPTAALAALALFATTAAPAQGLGGMLNSAKAKASQARVTPARAAQVAQAPAAAAQAGKGGFPANGEDPSTPPEMTPETEAEYTRLLLSDTRPVVPGQSNGSYTYSYRRLRQLQKFPVAFTWDQPALTRAVEGRIWLFGYVEDFSDDLVTSLTGSTREASLRPRLAKVKEIHFVSSDKKRTLDEPGEEQGWFYAFNPATGVLTAGFNEYASSVAAWGSLSKWIIKHVK